MNSLQIEPVMIIILGVIIGSFIGLVSYRLPRNIDIFLKRSSCDSCAHKLGFLDLIPIFSWLLNAKKCRYCKKVISSRYFIIEIISALILYLNYINFNLNVRFFLNSLICLLLLILIITDFEHYIIPDSIQIMLCISAILVAYLNHKKLIDLVYSSTSCLILGLILKFGFMWIRKKDGFGWGDVKFMLTSGLYISLNLIPIFLFISGILGIITGIIWQYLKKSKIFPFGPALALSLCVCIFVPKVEFLFNEYINNIVNGL